MEQNLNNLITEVRLEQQISPLFSDDIIKNYLKEGMQDINEVAGFLIDYETDLVARSLLKNYVMYANYKRLAEFKEVYISEYIKLQIKYHDNTDLP